eukprot:917701_1
MVTTRSQSKNRVEDEAQPNSTNTVVSHRELEEIITLSTFKNVNGELDELGDEKIMLEARIAALESRTTNLRRYLWTCLVAAIESGDLALVETLLSSQHLQPGSFARKDTGNSPLHVAVLLHRTSIVQRLLSVPGMDANPSNEEDFSPLMCAVRTGDLEMIEILLKHPRINVNYVSSCELGQTVLMVAIENGQIAAARLLLSHPAIDTSYEEDNTDKTAMICAILSGCTEIVQMLLERPDCNPNEIWVEHGDYDDEEDNYSILVHASKLGHTECVRLLLGHPRIKVTSTFLDLDESEGGDFWGEHANLIEVRDTAMKEAAERGNVEILKLFLDFKKNETDFSQEQVGMLTNAVKDGRVEIVYAFFESEVCRRHISDNDFVAFSLLSEAVYNGNVKLVEYILDSTCCSYRRICLKHLSIACSRKDLEMIRFLLNHPFMNFDRSEYDTSDGPLVDCVRAGYEEGVRLLLSHPKINISEKLIYGRTALHHAAETGNINIIRMLMSHFTGNYLDGASSIPAVVQRRRYLCTFVFLFALDKECKRASAYASQGSEAATYFKSEERTFVRWLLDCAHNTRQLPVELCAMIADFL